MSTSSAERAGHLAQLSAWAVAHVVVPAAVIGMATSLLWFLIDVRSVFLPGGEVLRMTGFWLIMATVLIVRYGRTGGERARQGMYLVLTAGATVFAVFVFSTGQTREGGPGAFVPALATNLLAFAAAWWLAAAIARQLSFEREVERKKIPIPWFGDGYREWVALRDAMRAQVEAAGAQPAQRAAGVRAPRPQATAVHDTWLSMLRSPWRVVMDPPDVDSFKNPTRTVRRLALGAMVVFALGEPLLLAGSPEVGPHAFQRMVTYLFCTAVVLGSGSAVASLNHALDRGGTIDLGLAAGRTLMAAALVTVVLVAGLALPGLRVAGTGVIERQGSKVQGRGDEATYDGQGDAYAGDPSEEDDDTGGESDARQAKQAPGRGFVQRMAASEWGRVLIRIGAFVVGVSLVVLAVAAISAWWRARAASGPKEPWWRELWRKWLGGRSERSQVVRADPFLGWDAMSRLSPRAAVEEAYGRLLDIAAWLGDPCPAQRTPLELARSLPRSLEPASEAVGRLTQLYVLAAYGPREVTEAQRDEALHALASVRDTVRPRA